MCDDKTNNYTHSELNERKSGLSWITLLKSFLSNMQGFLHAHFIVLRFLKLLLDKAVVNVECWLPLEELEASFPALNAFGSTKYKHKNKFGGFGVIL